MAEELLVVLNRSESIGFGFSLLGKPGFPPIIYNIVDDSPAAESGEVEVGDVILKINETDVNKFSTKEVLKCLRLSSDPVTLKIKRDPLIKATLKKHLLSNIGGGEGEVIKTGKHNMQSRTEPVAIHQPHSKSRTNGSCPPEQQPLLAMEEQHERLQWEPLGGGPDNLKKSGPKFEAYMMTGEHILNISRVPPQNSVSIIPKQQKKVDNLRYHNSHTHHLRHQQMGQQVNSMPNSPNETELGYKANSQTTSNSANTSPVTASRQGDHSHNKPTYASDISKTYNNSYVRTSRSEDQLQGQNDCSGMCEGGIVDDDITSSLNTLLDTRPETGVGNVSGGSNVSASSDSDRIVWTYNAPVSEHQKLVSGTGFTFAHPLSNGSSSSHSNSSSPLHSGSPASPTSVSSSVMSSHSSQSRGARMPYSITNGPMLSSHNGGDFSVSEAVSNISSPDYHDDDSMGMRDCVMECSDHSDSDSTLLVSEPRQKHHHQDHGDHRIVIQVKGPNDNKNKQPHSEYDYNKSGPCGYQISNEFHQQHPLHSNDYNENEESGVVTKIPSPQSSEDESDVESLHSFHYSPKAVDLPSAIRLAKRLYCLDGFKKSDVSRHLSKNNDFSRAVAEEYLKYFNFEKDTLDIALRKFLKQFSLTGETQERERVLVHFSKRYLDCNNGAFNSQDAVHTLTCAIMLLNTDLHGQNTSRKMTCNEFIENLAGLNECENFPREVLKQLYHAIKNYPLEWALDEDIDDGMAQTNMTKLSDQSTLGANPFLDLPVSNNAIEYKKGYVMRKCCYEANAKRTPFHKRSWKMFYCTLKDLVLYLHKDENGFRKNQMSDNFHNAIRIHHALATKASDYTKKQFVFRLQTADQAEYLFQTSDSKELQSWIDTINFVCASFSAPPLEAAVGSQKKFQRPLLPCSHTKLNLREQLRDHEERVIRLENDLEDHRQNSPEKGCKSLIVQNYREKEAYLNYEVKRYRTYIYMLRSKIIPPYGNEMGVSLVENSIGEVDEGGGGTVVMESGPGLLPPPIPERRASPPTNRYSYRQAIYSRLSNGQDSAEIG